MGDETELETRRKRLLYRSVYRGNKENDILLGQFARAHIAEFSAAELDQYESLLQCRRQRHLRLGLRQGAVPAGDRSRRCAQASRFPREVLGGSPRRPPRQPASQDRPLDPGRPARGRRRDGAGRARRDHRRPGHPARGARRPAAGAAAGRPALLRARARGSGLPGLGLPALRPAVAPSRHRRRAAGDAGAARHAEEAGRAGAHHPRLGRRGAAEGAAAQALRRGGDGAAQGRDVDVAAADQVSRRERLWPRRHGDGAGRVRGPRRPGRSLPARHQRAAAARPVRRRAGDRSARSIR